MALVLVCVILALGSYTILTLQQTDQGMNGPTTISVTGEGEVFATPDIGQFSFSVRAEGQDATEAQGKSAEAINAIMSYLKSEGVDEKDIKTQNYNLSPRYRYEERTCASGFYCPPGEQILDGYEVNQTISVKVRNLEKAGDLISGVGNQGATNISGLQFTIDDESVLVAEARDVAVADAKAKAREIADSLGVRLVKIVGFYEENDRPMPYGYGGDMMEMAVAKNDSFAAPSLPQGEQNINSRVNIIFEIR